MKLYWSACAIVIGVIGAAPFIDASSYKDTPREQKLTGEGVFMRTKMLRNQRSLSDQSRIVGGNDADIGKYPFFVEWEGCGASLVHKGKPSCKWKSTGRSALSGDSDLALNFLFRMKTHRHYRISGSLR